LLNLTSKIAEFLEHWPHLFSRMLQLQCWFAMSLYATPNR